MKHIKNKLSIILSLIISIFLFCPLSSNAASNLEIESPRAILMDGETGRILFEKNSEEVCSGTSIMKIMNILLAIEAIESGELEENDSVTVSDKASSTPGVGVWLKSGETTTVKELLKALSMVSANDAAIALAEYMEGSEGKFLSKMNEKATQLGMKNTIFKDIIGSDEDGNVTTALDVAIMSRELINHKTILPYCATWIDHIRNGSTQIVNTNKLLKSYPGTTGLKTGTSEKAGSCISATAEQNGIKLIAVILGSEKPDKRLKDIKSMLDYGFSEFVKVNPKSTEIPLSVKVKNGMTNQVSINSEPIKSILLSKKESQNITSQIKLTEELTAPIQKGQKIGEIIYLQNDNKLFTCDITTSDSVDEINFKDVFFETLKCFFKP